MFAIAKLLALKPNQSQARFGLQYCAVALACAPWNQGDKAIDLDAESCWQRRMTRDQSGQLPLLDVKSQS